MSDEKQSSISVMFERGPFFLSLIYLYTCAISLLWYSGYWDYFGLSYVSYSSVSSLFLGALSNRSALTMIALTALAIIGYISIWSINLHYKRSPPAITMIVALIATALYPVGVRFNGNLQACLHAHGYVGGTNTPLRVMTDQDGRNLVMLPSNQEYVLYVSRLGEMPTVAKRDSLRLTPTGQLHGQAAFQRDLTSEHPIIPQCRSEIFDDTWKEVASFFGFTTMR